MVTLFCACSLNQHPSEFWLENAKAQRRRCLNATGLGKVGQGNNGIVITAGASQNSIGNGTAAGRNIISGNAYDGIRIQDATTMSNTVRGNFIGSN